MLELKSLFKEFNGSPAVRGVDLSIPSGEFFSILGPSGCGKTTLLRILCGLEAPTSGEIWLDGERINALTADRRPFNLVFQRYALFPHLSVEGNVAFGLEMKKVPQPEREQRVTEALELVKMRDFARRGISTLSGGQQQRIALARALVNRPKVLLLDEPLSALDLKLRQEMQVELLGLQRRLGHTFVLVTHDQDEALTLSDRIAVMNEGVIEQVGTPQEIYEYPRTPFVARFIGLMNCFSGEVRSVAPDRILIGTAFRRAIQVKPSRDGSRLLPQTPVGTRVEVLVRPEKLKLLKSMPDPSQNAVEGILTDILYQGGVTQLMVQPRESGVAPIKVNQTNSAVSARRSLNRGDKVFVAWSPEDCVFLETESSSLQEETPGPLETPLPSESSSPDSTASSPKVD